MHMQVDSYRQHKTRSMNAKPNRPAVKRNVKLGNTGSLEVYIQWP
jgi:hypothetical protein